MIGYVLSFTLLVIGLVLDKNIAGFFYVHQNEALTNIFSVISDLGTGISVALIATLALAFLSKKNKEKNVILFWISLAATLAITYILKTNVLRERPMSFYNEPYDRFRSFPSGHTSSVFCALPFIKSIKLKNFEILWLVFSLAVAFSRVYLGFHYLSDVVAGGILGYVISEQIIKNFQKFQSTGGKKERKKRK